MDESYLNKARRLVQEHYNHHRATPDETPLHLSQVYIVWFSFTLGNWKALAGTTVNDGLYYEITHNDVKGETYFDTYQKQCNHVINDNKEN